MSDLSKLEIKALAKAAQMEIEEPELTEVAYHLNALLEAMDGIRDPGQPHVEPLPIPLPDRRR